MSAQPWEILRFFMFLVISLLIMFIGQGTGLMIGAVFNVVVSTIQIIYHTTYIYLDVDDNISFLYKL
jgi:hypothetical protein